MAGVFSRLYNVTYSNLVTARPQLVYAEEKILPGANPLRRVRSFHLLLILIHKLFLLYKREINNDHKKEREFPFTYATPIIAYRYYEDLIII
jgi:hypothetical protein